MVCWCDRTFFRVFLCGLLLALVLVLLSESFFFVAANAAGVGFLLRRFFVEVLLIGTVLQDWAFGAAGWRWWYAEVN